MAAEGEAKAAAGKASESNPRPHKPNEEAYQKDLAAIEAELAKATQDIVSFSKIWPMTAKYRRVMHEPRSMVFEGQKERR